jgi:O-antigen ligase
LPSDPDPSPPSRSRHPLPLQLAILQSVGISRFFAQQADLFGLASPLTSSASIRLAFLGAVALTLLAGGIGRFRPSLSLAALALLALASVFWSAAPDQTFREALLLIATGLLYAALAGAYDAPALILTLRNTLVAAIAVGLGLYLCGAPAAISLDRSADTLLGLPGLTGLFEHKVFAGVLALIAIVLVLRHPFRRRGLNAGAIVLAAAFLLLSDSRSALVLAGLAVPLLLFFRLRRDGDGGRQLSLALAFATLALGAAVLLGIEPLLGLLGRSADLTGRTPIWASALSLIDQRPWLGWGYGSIFGPDGAMASLGLAIGRGNWTTPHFHNDYLQLLVELGPLGPVLFIAALAGVLLRPATGDTARLVLGLLLVYAAVGEIFSAQKLGWLLLVFFACGRQAASVPAPAAPLRQNAQPFSTSNRFRDRRPSLPEALHARPRQ